MVCVPISLAKGNKRERSIPSVSSRSYGAIVLVITVYSDMRAMLVFLLMAVCTCLLKAAQAKWLQRESDSDGSSGGGGGGSKGGGGGGGGGAAATGDGKKKKKKKK